ncbi:MAG: hypothetical protein H7124_08460 [Phycisphaerales bacterium]|nr:hypothetical protein [Hyphomonadaceae bacterium]
MTRQTGIGPSDTRIGQMPVFFLHIPKTAGTAVRHFLEAPLRRHEVVRVSGDAAELKRRRAQPFGPDVKFLSGHVPYWFGDALPGPKQTLLFLRDPVERVMSTYFFWKSLPPPPPEDCSPEADLLRRMEGVSLEDFVLDPEGPGGGSISNFACRLVGHGAPWSLDCPFDASVQALACARLESIELLGVAERMPESLDLISRRLDMPYSGALPRQNETNGRRAAKDIAPSIVRAIRDANEGDIVLWERAQTELDRRLRADRPLLKPRDSSAPDHRYSPVMREGRLRLLPGEDPVLGAGWFAPERGNGRSWRFASAGAPTTLHVRLPTDQAYVMVIDSPFAAAGFDYNALAVKVDDEPVECFAVALPDRTLIITAPIHSAKADAREIAFEKAGAMSADKSRADHREISFAVQSIAWLPWTSGPAGAWTALQHLTSEMAPSLAAARADKANIIAHVSALHSSIETKNREIQSLQAELDKRRHRARAHAF